MSTIRLVAWGPLACTAEGRGPWRAMAVRAGFEVVDVGVFNSAWFVVLQKPAATSAA